MSRFTTPQLVVPVTLANDDAPLFQRYGRFGTRMDWVLLAVASAALPHYAHVPWWVLLAVGSVLLIQSSWFRRHIRLTPRTQRNLLLLIMLGGLAGTLLQFQVIWGLDAGMVLLLACLAGKLLEFESRRDAYVLLNLGLFLVGGLFLFDQGLATALQAVLATGLILLAMIMLNDLPDQVQVEYATNAKKGFLSPPRPPLHTMVVTPTADTGTGTGTGLASLAAQSGLRQERGRRLGWLLAQALPLLIVLFVLFPRFPPIWSLRINQGSATTGMSDSMSPGDIASLSQSTALAFRVISQQGQLPARGQLYWRGLVFGQFDGTTWRPVRQPVTQQSFHPGQPAAPWAIQSYQPALVAGSPSFNYRVILEPTSQPWLYALSLPLSQQQGIRISREYNLFAERDITRRFQYDAIQLPVYQADPVLPAALRELYLQLPAGNPQARQLARQWFTQSGHDPQQYATQLLRWIGSAGFSYTLAPPPLSGDRIDQFLFSTRRGFCEHYASAYVYLLRAAGIPARVVAGYQGGQPAPDNQSWEVRQMDAHAWAEAWFDGRGWVQLDPTAAVAPDRIEQGMDSLARQERQLFGDGLLGNFRQNQFQMLQGLRRWSDYAAYLWQRDVVGFDQDKQGNLLGKWGIRSLTIQLLILCAVLAVLIAILAGWVWWRRRKRWHPLDTPLQQLSQRLQRHGLARASAEGVLDWLQRLETSGRLPSAQIQEIRQLYRQARYQPVSPEQAPQHPSQLQASQQLATGKQSHTSKQLQRLVRKVRIQGANPPSQKPG